MGKMTERNGKPTHDIFTIARTYRSAPAKVFSAWSDPDAKAAWFAGGEGWIEKLREFDFRVGGRDRLVGQKRNGFTSDYRATYHDIVPEQRIVTAYEMRLDDWLISVSLATLTFEADGAGTRMTWTEQGVFLNGYEDKGSRQEGTQQLVDRVEALLEGRKPLALRLGDV